jgi:hypothetical protein
MPKVKEPLSPELSVLVDKIKFPFRIVHRAAVEKFLMNVAFWRYMAYIRARLPQYMRVTGALDIPRNQMVAEMKCLVHLYGQHIGVEELRYNVNNTQKKVSNELQELWMLSLGYLLSGALAIAPDANTTAPGGAAQENNRIAQVRQSLGIKGLGAPPAEPAKPAAWNELKIGGTSLSKMQFL